MSPEQLALLHDSRISREARILGLCISGLGDGEHQVSHEDFRTLLGRGSHGMAKDRTISGYLSELESYGWLTRRAGGRGPSFYTFTCPWEAGRDESLPAPGSLYRPPGDVLPASGRPVDVRVVVEEEEVVVEGEGRAREAVTYPIAPEIEAILTDGRPSLEGCRGPLRDYLRTRTHPDGHIGYVRSLQSWLQGGTGAPRGLHKVTNPTHLIATALNDLLTEDERLMKSGRGQVGVIANLRTKIEVLAAAELGERKLPTPAKPTTPAAPAAHARRSKFPKPEKSTDVARPA